MVEDDVSTASSSSRDVRGTLPDIDDDSSFIGDQDVKDSYTKSIAKYKPNDYWRVHDWNIQVIARRAVTKAPEEWPTADQRRQTKNKSLTQAEGTKRRTEASDPRKTSHSTATTAEAKKSELFNPYEGEESALQLNEPVSSFLSRLQPSKTTIGKPWIWVANFHSRHRPLNEDIPSFRQQGSELLDSFLSKKLTVEANNPQKPAGAVTRMLTPDRKILEYDLRKLAKLRGVSCGKWMLFPYLDKVDEVWTAVVHGTVDGRLGCAAKVAATADTSDGARLICVYTEDFSNVADVKRVLKEIHRLNLIDIAGHNSDGERGNSIYYKCDAYTHLDITSQNVYKLRASMYSSKDMLAELKAKGQL